MRDAARFSSSAPVVLGLGDGDGSSKVVIAPQIVEYDRGGAVRPLGRVLPLMSILGIEMACTTVMPVLAMRVSGSPSACSQGMTSLRVGPAHPVLTNVTERVPIQLQDRDRPSNGFVPDLLQRCFTQSLDTQMTPPLT
jgi:hypothetical protein